MEPTKVIDVSDCGHDGLLDRISQLSDSVLNLILCKVMDTRQVLQPMILSKTWQNLWAPVAYLCFHDSFEDFSFASFVNTVLQLRDPSDIHTFRVQWRHSVDAHRDHHLTQWAEHIVRCNVKVLELDIYAGEHTLEVVEFPRCIFTCQILEVLKLETEWMRTKLSPRSIVQLSRLRKLHLIGFYADCDSLKNLISGCPVLEDLEFVECNLEDPEVSSDTLRQLIIKSSDISGTRMHISGTPQIAYPAPPYQQADMTGAPTKAFHSSSAQFTYQQAHQFHLQQQQQQQQKLQAFWSKRISEIEETKNFKNYCLPLAQIKKIMKADEDVRMISAEAPVVFSKACEIFAPELTCRAWMNTEENKRRILLKNDINAAITRTDIFDFLVDIIPKDELREEGLGIPGAALPVVGGPADLVPYYDPPPQHQVGAPGMFTGASMDQAPEMYAAALPHPMAYMSWQLSQPQPAQQQHMPDYD